MKPPCSTSGRPTAISLRLAALSLFVFSACAPAPAPPGATIVGAGGDRHAFTLLSDAGPALFIEGHYPAKTKLFIQPLEGGARIETRVLDASLTGPIFSSAGGKQVVVPALALGSAESMRSTPSGRALLRLDVSDGSLRRRYALGQDAFFYDAVDAEGGTLAAWSDAEGFATALAADQPALSEVTRLESLERPAAARFSRDGKTVGAVLVKAGLSKLVVAGAGPGARSAAAFPLPFAEPFLLALPGGGWLAQANPENGLHVLAVVGAGGERRVVAASSQPFSSAVFEGDEAFAVSARAHWADRAQLHRFSLSGAGERWTIPWTDKPTRLARLGRDGRLAVALEEGRGGLWLIPADRASLEAARAGMDAALRAWSRPERYFWGIILGFGLLLLLILAGLKA